MPSHADSNLDEFVHKQIQNDTNLKSHKVSQEHNVSDVNTHSVAGHGVRNLIHNGDSVKENYKLYGHIIFIDNPLPNKKRQLKH